MKVCLFSGGESSAMMTVRIVESSEFDPRDWIFLFANTGREFPETLDFVERLDKRYNLDLAWLEYRTGGNVERVCRQTASTGGEPFEQMLDDAKMFPSIVNFFCDSRLKWAVFRKWIVENYKLPDGVINYHLGYRIDEPHLIRTANRNVSSNEYISMPLVVDRIDGVAVENFWQARDEWRLKFPRYKTNCDGCPFKGAGDITQIMREYPERMRWWVEQSERFPTMQGEPNFIMDRSYSDLFRDRDKHINHDPKNATMYQHFVGLSYSGGSWYDEKNRKIGLYDSKADW